MIQACLSISAIYSAIERFFFVSGDARICSVIRIAYAAILLPYLWIFGLDLHLFFGESGIMPYEVSRAVIDPDAFSVLAWLAPNPLALNLCFVAFWLNVILLLFGVQSRFQAAAIFFWLVAFQHRNVLLLDGEDIIARWLAFSLILMPCGEHWSVDAWRRRIKGCLPRERYLLGLRILQVEMTLIYASTALLKLDGVDWLSGTAVIYAVQLTDLFGRFPLPEFYLSSPALLKATTWAVLTVECWLPIGLWLKETRKFTLVLGLLLHLGLDYSMNLFLFQWFMIIGLGSFIYISEKEALVNSGRK